MHFCTHCDEGTLTKLPPDEPWNPAYYICDHCDSTFTVDQIEDEEIDTEDQRGCEMVAYMNVGMSQLVNSLK